MPKVLCSHCGEELMGAVNRCWRCGRTFVAEHNPDGLPPIRRRPIPPELVNKTWEELAAPRVESGEQRAESEVWIAERVEEGADSRSGERGASRAASEEPKLRETGDAFPNEPHPLALQAPSFALHSSSGSPPSALRPSLLSPPRAPAYPTNAGATGGAIAAVVLGVMALVTISLITPGALLISLLGVGMGIWGLHSDRRGVAIFGLLLCCLAMTISGFLSAVQLYELIYGYSPFDADLPPVDVDGSSL